MDPQPLSQVPLSAAALAGVGAAVLMDQFLIGLRAAGLIRYDLRLLMGSVFAPPGPYARLVGLIWELMSALAFGAIYAMIFDLFHITPGVPSGAALGLIHGILSGLSLVTLPFRNRRVALGEVADPGPFALNFGWPSAAALVGSRVLFGAVFGFFYPVLASL